MAPGVRGQVAGQRSELAVPHSPSPSARGHGGAAGRASVSLEQRPRCPAPHCTRSSPRRRGLSAAPAPLRAGGARHLFLVPFLVPFLIPRLSLRASFPARGRPAQPPLQLPGGSRRPPSLPRPHGWEEPEEEEEGDGGDCGVPALPRQFPPSTGRGAPRIPRGGSGCPHPARRSCSRHPGSAAPAPAATAAGCAPPAPSRGPSSCPQLPRGRPGGAGAAAGWDGAADGAGGAAPPAVPGGSGCRGAAGARGSRRAPVAVTAMAVTAAHAQAGPRVSSDEPEPAGSRSAAGGGCGSAGGDTARARRDTAVMAPHLARTNRAAVCVARQPFASVHAHLPETWCAQRARATPNRASPTPAHGRQPCGGTNALHAHSRQPCDGTHSLHTLYTYTPTAGSHVLAQMPYTHFTHTAGSHAAIHSLYTHLTHGDVIACTPRTRPHTHVALCTHQPEL
ncbi:collagen alpha-1(I) chain-like isoform X2 [Passer montanus]|uniref:collagen alpha-1(I) chain-like isoform X2 n=1 Tax=Passer montanus TaxID=9160 RepID=UPI00195F8671|nr:collagen alpha-1(I) chain-like isoform X2 [Passer montanus]